MRGSVAARVRREAYSTEEELAGACGIRAGEVRLGEMQREEGAMGRVPVLKVSSALRVSRALGVSVEDLWGHLVDMSRTYEQHRGLVSK